MYDRDSNRTGYGYVSPSGKIETYDLRGNRTGSGVLTPSGGVIRQEKTR